MAAVRPRVEKPEGIDGAAGRQVHLRARAAAVDVPGRDAASIGRGQPGGGGRPREGLGHRRGTGNSSCDRGRPRRQVRRERAGGAAARACLHAPHLPELLAARRHTRDPARNDRTWFGTALRGDMEELFSDAVRKLLQDVATPAKVRAIEEGASSQPMWQAFQEAGFADLGMPEEHGGGALSLPALLPIAEACGEFVLPVPLMETIWARAMYPGLLPDCALALASAIRMESGVRAARVALGRTAPRALVQCDG